MIIGISVDVNQLDKCHHLITQNLDIIEHVQFYLDDTPLHIQEAAILKFQDCFYDKNLTYSLHSYGYINFCEAVEEIRNSWLNVAYDTLSLAQKTSCIFVNYHMGYTFTKSIARKVLLKRLCESLDYLSKFAQKILIDINIENDFTTPEIERLGSQVEDLNTILNQNYPHLKLCYDIGHANIAFPTPYEYQKYIEFIQSFHIHNNWGTDDVHNPFGDNGSINCDYVLSELMQKNSFFILENELDVYNIALNNLRDSLSVF